MCIVHNSLVSKHVYYCCAGNTELCASGPHQRLGQNGNPQQPSLQEAFLKVFKNRPVTVSPET